MKTNVTYTYEDSDYELLSPYKVFNLPKSPCNICGAGASCCGCNEYTKYCNAWKPYKDANIEEIAKNMIRRNEIQYEISELQDEYNELTNKIPSEFLSD